MCFSLKSKVALRELSGKMIRLTNSQRYNSQSRVLSSSSGKLASIRYEQVLDIMCLSPLVNNTVSSLFRHTVCTQVVG